ncbi:MAG: zf-HC2 domain-containing protein [Planctomycetota bacterium]
MSSHASIQCDVVQALVPTYVDEEVTESVAGSIRAHLIDCPVCRAVVQEELALRQWFEPTDEVEVPEGFAARVARRAFAGDEGLAPVTITPAASEGGRLLSFSRGLVAAAAAAMIAVTLFLASQELPSVGEVGAGPDLDQALEELEDENRAREAELEDSGAATER